MSPVTNPMQAAKDQIARTRPERLPGWLLSIGVAAWIFIGVSLVVVIVAWFLGVTSSISIPLILAFVIGVIAFPLVEKLMARRVPQSVAATLVIGLLIAVVMGVGWLVVAGVVAQWPEIQKQLQTGLADVSAWLNSMGFNGDSLQAAYEQAKSAAGTGAAGGLASKLGATLASGLSGLFALLFGVFIATLLLYYVLSDYENISSWVAGHLGVPPAVGDGIVDDAVRALRGYFRGTTITGFLVALVIGFAMLVMRVPLALPVMLVTFLTCYIPYFGAIISGAFAFLVALSAGGLPTASAVLVVVLIAQNVLQTVVNAKVMGSSLALSPIVVLVATMLGGIFGGLLGAALGAPIAALTLSVFKRLRAAFTAEPDAASLERPESPTNEAAGEPAL